MIPENFVLPETIKRGFEELARRGFVHIIVQCVRVKTLTIDMMVPVVVAKHCNNIDDKRSPQTLMFFGEQAEGEEGGIARYVLFEVAPNQSATVVELPTQTAPPQYLNWDRAQKAPEPVSSFDDTLLDPRMPY